MPGFDDVDGRFGAKAEAAALDRVIARHGLSHLTDAERGVREDCAAAAKAIGDGLEQVTWLAPEGYDPDSPHARGYAAGWKAAKAIGDEAAQEGVLRWIKGQSAFVEGAFANFYCSEDGMKRFDQLDRDALLKAANEMAGEIVTLRAAANRSDLDAEDRREVRRQALTLAVQVFVSDATPQDAELLDIARECERYLLGDDDPPKGERDFRTGEPVKNQGEWMKD